MKILIAPDKFKSSLSAHQISEVIAKNLSGRGYRPTACPLADGGEGTASILTELAGGRLISVSVHDPLMRIVTAAYGLSPDGSTAFIEMAHASGLWRLKKNESDPRVTTTAGTGELIVHALDSGVKKIILGCGGSATNDGGVGMAAALGWKFFDFADQEFIPTGGTLVNLQRIEDNLIHPRIRQVSFMVISDVTNPLTGSNGAAYTFGPQKGADVNSVKRLDEGLIHLDRIFSKYSGRSFDSLPGSGAGGGMGAGARFFLNAEWVQGIHYVIQASGLEEKIKESDLVITGEGKLDHQSLQGKVVSGVSMLCKKHERPLWVICGINELDGEEIRLLGAERIISIGNLAGKMEESMRRPAYWIDQAISQAFQ